MSDILANYKSSLDSINNNHYNKNCRFITGCESTRTKLWREGNVTKRISVTKWHNWKKKLSIIQIFIVTKESEQKFSPSKLTNVSLYISDDTIWENTSSKWDEREIHLSVWIGNESLGIVIWMWIPGQSFATCVISTICPSVSPICKRDLGIYSHYR